MNSSTSGMLPRISATLLAVCGLSLLFAGDLLLPRLATGFSAEVSWFGQLLAAAWLSLAVLNWVTRSSVLGGIYGRPIVLANTTLYFVSAMVLVKAASRADLLAIWVAVLVAGAMAFLYGSLLFGRPRAITDP
jgi:hypothetical protein